MREFARSWTADVLEHAPLIAPARQVMWPRQVAGEEDALARGAMRLMVRPRTGGAFLATCARGFAEMSLPTGVWGCPDEDSVCAVAGGYAYVADTTAPERCVQVGLRPVVEVRPAVEAGLLLFAGFRTLVAWGRDGVAWETRRLSWDGVRVTEVTGDEVRGMGWDMMRDEEVGFRVELGTGKVEGGGWL